jgi:hypothetical protein
MFGRSDKTDINGLKFVAAVCAIIAERENLLGMVVYLHYNSTATVVWLNKQRTSQLFGQAWIRLLIAVIIKYDIMIDCVHIAGAINTLADALSCFLQTPELISFRTQSSEQPLLSATSHKRSGWCCQTDTFCWSTYQHFSSSKRRSKCFPSRVQLRGLASPVC